MAEGDGFQIGNAYGKIVISTDSIDAAVDSAKRSIDSGLTSIGDSFRKIGEGFSRIGSGLTTLTAPLAIVGGVGLKSASEFGTLLKQIEIFGSVAPENLDRVREFALKMGADTKFSASDAAAAMLDLLKSGQSVEESMATLKPVLDLAATGNLNLAEAAGIVSTGLAVFKLKAEDASRVSNALAKAANASRADVRDLGAAMVDAGPVADMFGLSVEELAAMLGVFAQNGIMGAAAGTQLRSMLTNMNENTPKTKAAWAELNVEMYDSQGNMRDLNEVIKDLDKALDKLPVKDQNRLMQQLGGTYGIVGLSALRAAGGIDNMMGAMGAAPDAAAVAEAFMNTFEGSVESLKGSFETLMIQGLTPFMDNFLTPMVKQLTEVINKFTEWVQANPELTTTIVKIVAALIVLGPVLIVIGQVITAITSIVTGLSFVFGGLLGPVGLIIAAAVLLYLAFKNNFLGIRDLIEPIIKNVVTGFKTLVGVFQNFGNIIQNQGIGTAIASVINAFMQMFGLVENDQMAQSAMDIGNGIVSAFLGVVSFIQNSVMPVLTDLYNWFVTDALPAVVGFITNVVVPAVERFVGFLQDFWTQIQPGLNSFFTWVTQDALPLVVDFFTNVLSPAINSFITGLGNIWAVVGPVLVELFNWFMANGLPAITSAVSWFMDNIVTPLITLLGGIWESIGPILGQMLDWFITTGLPAINDAITWFKDSILQPAIDILEGLWIVIEPVLAKIYDWFVTTALPAINTAVTWFSDNIISPLITLISGLWTSVKPSLESIYNWFRDSFQWIGDTFIKPVVDFIQKIIDGVQNALNELQKLGGGGGVTVEGSGGTPTAAGLGIQFKDSGGPGLAGMPYLIGAPQMNQEVYVPNTNGQFIPNFMDMVQGAIAASKGGAGMVFEPGSIAIYANSYEEGQAAGAGFQQQIQELIDSRGD